MRNHFPNECVFRMGNSAITAGCVIHSSYGTSCLGFNIVIGDNIYIIVQFAIVENVVFANISAKTVLVIDRFFCTSSFCFQIIVANRFLIKNACFARKSFKSNAIFNCIGICARVIITVNNKIAASFKCGCTNTCYAILYNHARERLATIKSYVSDGITGHCYML